jgi:Uncharacterized lipoprotein
MKSAWIILFTGLLCNVPLASAEAMTVDLNIPDVRVNGLQGNDIVALQVVDDRQDTLIGRDTDGDDLIVERDMAAALMDGFSTSLRLAGFSLEPYRADAALSMVVHVRSLGWTSEAHFVTSTVHLSSGVVVTVARNGKQTIEQTIGTTGDYTVAWHPDSSKINGLVSGALADVVRAVLQNSAIVAALQATPQASQSQ